MSSTKPMVNLISGRWSTTRWHCQSDSGLFQNTVLLELTFSQKQTTANRTKKVCSTFASVNKRIAASSYARMDEQLNTTYSSLFNSHCRSASTLITWSTGHILLQVCPLPMNIKGSSIFVIRGILSGSSIGTSRGTSGKFPNSIKIGTNLNLKDWWL